MHDLTNHLGVIVGFSELLRDSVPDDDPRHADVIEILDAARAAVAIVAKMADAK